MIESYGRQKKQDYKAQISFGFAQAKQIGLHVAKLFEPDKVKILSPWDYFPGIFDEEIKEIAEQERLSQLQLYQAQMQDYAFRFNSDRGRR